MSWIAVGNPRAADVLRVGSEYDILWEFAGTAASHVRITLRRNSAPHIIVHEIAASAENTGRYTWRVGINIEIEDEWFIRIRALESAAIYGDSDVFETTDKMTISEFARLENFQKSILVEIITKRIIDTVFIGDRFLLQENGDFLLQENNDKIILEQSIEA